MHPVKPPFHPASLPIRGEGTGGEGRPPLPIFRECKGGEGYNFTFSSVKSLASSIAAARIVIGKRPFNGLMCAPSAVGA